MKRRLFNIIFCFMLGVLCGCQKTQKIQSIEDGLDIEVLGGTTFPIELAGTWRCQENKWEIIIEENGTVSWVLNPLGGAWMEPGKKLEVPMKMNRISTYDVGEWKAVYDHKTSFFTIEIIIPYFEIGMGMNTLHGDSVDIFSGRMDAEKEVWEAEWFSTATYIVSTKELGEHELDMSDDPNKGVVIFKRFDVVN
jgi:hypothetical protein